MINLLLFTPNGDDATSYYRGWGPWNHIAKFQRKGTINKKLNLISGTGLNLTWRTVQTCDVAFVQRPYDNQHVVLCEMIKNNGLPLWLDYDDDLFCVPSDNPAHVLYSRPEVQKNIAMMCAMADVITVSTEHLKRRLEKLSKNIVVIPNALNEHVCKHTHPKAAKQTKSIMWRGSATHVRDLMTYGDKIISAINDSKDLTWLFVGYTPWFVGDYVDKKKVAPVNPMDPIEYQHFIRNVAPMATHVPLHDNDFNQSKSNIAYIEAVWAGGVALVPAWEEWKRPGAIFYNDHESYAKGLAALMELNDTQIAERNADGWAWVWNNRLEVQNQKRNELLRSLLK